MIEKWPVHLQALRALEEDAAHDAGEDQRGDDGKWQGAQILLRLVFGFRVSGFLGLGCRV